MTEVKTRANPNYEASAVNLQNNTAVLDELKQYAILQGLADHCRGILEQMPEFKAWVEAGARASERKEDVEKAIEQFGSYQDIVNGHYAVKQRKVSVSYNAQAFENCFPEYSQAVVVKAVDVTKIKALIKGGLLTEGGLKNGGVTTETESFTYIIR